MRLINKTCASNVCANVEQETEKEREREEEKEDRQFDRGSAGYHVNRQRRHLVKITHKRNRRQSQTSHNVRFLSYRYKKQLNVNVVIGILMSQIMPK